MQPYFILHRPEIFSGADKKSNLEELVNRNLAKKNECLPLRGTGNTQIFDRERLFPNLYRPVSAIAGTGLFLVKRGLWYSSGLKIRI